MKKAVYMLFIVLFFALCLVPCVGLLLAGPSEAAANEAPAAAPRLTNYDGAVNTDFLTDFADYVNSGFYLRLEGITVWDELCAKVFRTSARDDVLLGPDGWLFYGADLGDITGADQMTDAEIWACARSLYLMQEYAQSQGARFLFAVPCGKCVIYPEHAPDYVTVAEGGNLARLSAAMEDQGVRYADLYTPFAAADDTLYWQWDSHWNGKGAALGADVILEELGLEGGWHDGAFIEAEQHAGDLYKMLFPAGKATEEDCVPAGGFSFVHTSDYHGYDDMTITTAREGAAGALLLMRDSSGRNLYPYLADCFASAYITRANNYPLYKIDETGATAAVAELCQRNLSYLLKYPAVYPAPIREYDIPADAVPEETEIVEDTPADGPDGYIRLRGTLEQTPGAPVYLLADGVLYEGIPGVEGFTAWLPAGTDADGVRVYIPDGGK